MARLSAIAGGDTSVPFPEDFFENLYRLLGLLQDKIVKGEETHTVLEKIANLTYLLSGNGYYLTQKGVKVFSL